MWHDMGEPASLTESQKELLREAAMPFVESCTKATDNGVLTINKIIDEFGVIYFEASKVTAVSDRGYSYSRSVMC